MVWWVGAARSSLYIFSEKYFEDSFTEEGTVAENAIFEGRLKFAASDTRKEFSSKY